MNRRDSAKEISEQCDVLVGAPGSFYWFGEHSVYFGKEPALVQPIPRYLYVGLKERKSGNGGARVVLSKAPSRTNYWINDQINIRSLDNSVSNKDINQLVKRIYKRNMPFDVKIISEIPIECGLNSSGALSAAITTALYIHIGYLNERDINKWKEHRILDFFSDEKFQRVFSDAKFFDSLVAPSLPTGNFSFQLL